MGGGGGPPDLAETSGEVKDGNRRRPHSIGNEKENELGFSTLEMNSIEVKNY